MPESKPEMLPFRTKDDLPTPALVVDLDAFEQNMRRMSDHTRQSGKLLRPHAKTHKCLPIAQRQIKSGAVGVCVANLSEAELMVTGGVPGVFLTSPLASRPDVEWMVRLAASAGDLMMALDHPRQVALYQEAAANHAVHLNILIDLDVGDRRTGAAPGETALSLAKAISDCKNLRFRGLQAYSGRSSHVVGYQDRCEHTRQAMAQVAETRTLLQRHGYAVEIVAGGSTGTYNIDSEQDVVTELQAGSYIFMDVDYHRIGGSNGDAYDDFEQSLSVLATVVSANHASHITIDAGIKAFATDRRFGPEPKNVAGVSYRFGGDEFGILVLENPERALDVGDRIEFVVPHCDPTVNLYDRIYACRGDVIEEVWPIMNRV